MTQCDPPGELIIRTVAMPADMNYEGHVFGGWLMSQMDLAGGLAARERAKGRVATVAVEAMQFHVAMALGDELSCYAALLRVGRTSLTYKIEAWVKQRGSGERFKATEGTFTYVAVSEDGQPRTVPEEIGEA